jgi:hypothetical protein
MTTSIANVVDLSAQRSIVLKQRGLDFTLTLRPITKEDWFAYFDKITITAEQRGRETIRTTQAGAAGIELVDKIIVGAEGYPLPEGVTALTEVADWQTKLPLSHRLSVLDVLLDVRAVELADDEPFLFDRETVCMEALWSADEAGNMHRVTGLRHVFQTPSTEHYRSYMSQISRSVVVGGSRSGRTVYSGAQRVLCDIYDDLIKEIHGYSFNGSTNVWSDAMDTRHKVVAAERLFAAVEAEEQ